MQDFIEVYDGVFMFDVCCLMIECFEVGGQVQCGSIGSGVDLMLKDSWDVQFDIVFGWVDVCQQLNDVMLKGFIYYLCCYVYVVLVLLQLKMKLFLGEMQVIDVEVFVVLDDQVFVGLIGIVF